MPLGLQLFGGAGTEGQILNEKEYNRNREPPNWGGFYYAQSTHD